ncbi:hypothetical protein FS749_016032 [Ceratobasidium sp. UAMH 11750]|nr:hypothetical protein FS749_016032 [Ceratobasidium sp. UAMH 11750]
MLVPSALYLVLGLMILPFAAALTFLVGSDYKSLTAVSFTVSSGRSTLSVLNRIPVTTSGTLVSNQHSPTVIFQLSPSQDIVPAFRVRLQQNNVTLAPLEILAETSTDRSHGCMLSLYDGQHISIDQNEMESVRRSIAVKQLNTRLDDLVDAVPDGGNSQQPQQPISDGAKTHQACPERLLEHNRGLSALDSKTQTLKTLTRTGAREWELKSTINLAEGRYADGVAALAYGRFLYLLDPTAGVLSRHFLSDPTVLAQNLNLDLGTASPPGTGTILLSFRSSRFPNAYIYATRGNMLFVIALPNDPFDDLHIVARIKTTLSSVTTAVLVSDEGRYLVLGGEGGLRVYQRVMGGASVVEVARLDMRDTPSSLLWL